MTPSIEDNGACVRVCDPHSLEPKRFRERVWLWVGMYEKWLVVRLDSREVGDGGVGEFQFPRVICEAVVKSLLDVISTHSFIVPSERVVLESNINKSKFIYQFAEVAVAGISYRFTTFFINLRQYDIKITY